MESTPDNNRSNGRMKADILDRNDSSSSPRNSRDGDSPVASPPYWAPHSHTRSMSNVSIESVLPGGIILRDNTDSDSDKNGACWAKAVHIEDHVIINDGKTGIGAFVVWNITVETLSVSMPLSHPPHEN